MLFCTQSLLFAYYVKQLYSRVTKYKPIYVTVVEPPVGASPINRTSSTLKRRRRSTLPDPGHKTVEVAFFADKAFMNKWVVVLIL